MTRDLGSIDLDLFQHLDPVSARHLDIHDDQVGGAFLHPIQCFIPVLGSEDGVFPFHHPFQRIPDRFVIIDDQNGLHLPPLTK